MKELIKRICFYIEIKADRIKSKARLRKMKRELSNLQWELFVTKKVNHSNEDISAMVNRVEQLQKAITLEQSFILK